MASNDKKYTVKFRQNEVAVWEVYDHQIGIDISEARRAVADHYKTTYYSVLGMDDQQFLKEFQVR